MSRFREAYEDARRLRQVVVTLFDAGFSRYVDAARLQYLVPWRKRLSLSLLAAAERERLERPTPVRVREAMEKLGPTFMKFGQMLSLRADLVGEKFAREFAKLQETAQPVPFADVIRVVQEELGKPLPRAFVRFERRPYAAASLAQVHRAELSGGRRIAVKVQRPGIRAVVEKDVHLMLLLAHLLERSSPALSRYRPVSLVKEFADWTLRELDFSVEAANIDRFRVNFSDEPEIRIPEVVWSHTTRRLLTMELISGERISAFFLKKRSKEFRLALAQIALRALLKMYFLDGFFQADPHPGNFVVLPGPKLAFLDLGMVGYLTAEHRAELIGCFLSYVNRDTESYTRHLLELAEKGASGDENGFRRDVQGILDRLMYKPVKQKRIAEAFYRVINLGAAKDIHFPTDLVLLARSLVTAEQVALRLAPDIDLDDVLKPFLNKVWESQLNPGKIVAGVRSNAFDYFYFLKTLPERTLGLMKKLESGEIGVKLNFDELRDLKEEFDRENDVRVIAIVAAALFVGAAVLLQIRADHVLWGFPIGHLALLSSLALFLWTAFLVMRRPRG